MIAMNNLKNIAVIIPCYKVKRHVLDVIRAIGSECLKIYVIDDCCPDSSGEFVRLNCTDSRVVVIRNATNMGVGGAVMVGYQAAIADGMDVLVKIDGDGQMDPVLIPHFINPILQGDADYTKGNRFFDLEQLNVMPTMRLFGNALLSFMSKLSSGYWDLFDPTNGYTAIHTDVARRLPFAKISNRYFFETDMLFRLNTLRAVVVDIPMDARYGEEVSNLKISTIIGEFLLKHIRNFGKRIFYNYYLRDLSLASLELPVGLLMLGFGVLFGGWSWLHSTQQGVSTPAGTVMLAALPTLMGLQFILAFLGNDIASVPRRPIHGRIQSTRTQLRSAGKNEHLQEEGRCR
jgi:glycosyltransferase involved in cell wall biosynthesis